MLKEFSDRITTINSSPVKRRKTSLANSAGGAPVMCDSNRPGLSSKAHVHPQLRRRHPEIPKVSRDISSGDQAENIKGNITDREALRAFDVQTIRQPDRTLYDCRQDYYLIKRPGKTRRHDRHQNDQRQLLTKIDWVSPRSPPFV